MLIIISSQRPERKRNHAGRFWFMFLVSALKPGDLATSSSESYGYFFIAIRVCFLISIACFLFFSDSARFISSSASAYALMALSLIHIAFWMNVFSFFIICSFLCLVSIASSASCSSDFKASSCSLKRASCSALAYYSIICFLAALSLALAFNLASLALILSSISLSRLSCSIASASSLSFSLSKYSLWSVLW